MQITFDTYRQRLAQLSKHPQVAGFLRWWLTELGALLPAQWRSSSLDLTDAVIIQPTPSGVCVSRFDNGQLTEVGVLNLEATPSPDQRSTFKSLLDKMPGKPGKLVIVLPAEAVLVKKITLPLAVEENLENVLAFEMDRHTPFKAEQVCSDFRILQRDNQNQRISLEIAVTPRDVVEQAVARIENWGETPAMVTVLAQGKPSVHFNLLPRARRPKPSSFLNRRNGALLALVLVLAAAALLLPIIMKREAVLQLMPIVERVKQAAETTDGLHRKLDALVAQHNFLLEKKRNSPVLVVVFDELARTLPEDTWVQQLDLKGKELQIMGETGSSSKLIGLMEQSKILHDTNFRSPLTKGQKPNSERFHLVTEIKPLPDGMVAASPQAPPPAAPPANTKETAKPEAAPPASKSAQENS